MTLVILSAILFALAAFDSRLTARRMGQYGVNVELNPAIRGLATRMGPELAVLIGIMVPNVLLITVGYALNWKVFLAILVGFKLRYFWNQLQSLQFEREAKAIAKEINSKNRAGGAQPSSATDVDTSDSSLTGPSSFGGK